jgi:hypothetical protein
VAWGSIHKQLNCTRLSGNAFSKIIWSRELRIDIMT